MHQVSPAVAPAIAHHVTPTSADPVLPPTGHPWPFAPLTDAQLRDRAALERALRADRLASFAEAPL